MFTTIDPVKGTVRPDGEPLKTLKTSVSLIIVSTLRYSELNSAIIITVIIIIIVIFAHKHSETRVITKENAQDGKGRQTLH